MASSSVHESVCVCVSACHEQLDFGRRRHQTLCSAAAFCFCRLFCFVFFAVICFFFQITCAGMCMCVCVRLFFFRFCALSLSFGIRVVVRRSSVAHI